MRKYILILLCTLFLNGCEYIAWKEILKKSCHEAENCDVHIGE